MLQDRRCLSERRACQIARPISRRGRTVTRVAGPFVQLGAYAALAAVVGVLVLGALYLSMKRDLRDLRRRQTREGRQRQFLDEAAAAFEDAHITLSEMAVDLLSTGRSPGLQESVARAVFAVKVMRRRVGMRFPPEHPVSVAYGGVEQSIDARGSYLTGIVDRLGEGETMPEGEETYDIDLREKARVAFGKFSSAARDEVALAAAEPGRRQDPRSPDRGLALSEPSPRA